MSISMIPGATCAAFGLTKATVFGMVFTPIEAAAFRMVFNPTEAVLISGVFGLTYPGQEGGSKVHSISA